MVFLLGPDRTLTEFQTNVTRRHIGGFDLVQNKAAQRLWSDFVSHNLQLSRSMPPYTKNFYFSIKKCIAVAASTRVSGG